jgi:hypothetical protein
MKTAKEYIASLPQERREAMLTLLNCLRDNLPAGFEEGISYGMITFSVPLSTYPKGYHATPLDMGKSCIRFKQPGQIPLTLIAALAKKMTPEEYVGVYEGVTKFLS